MNIKEYAEKHGVDLNERDLNFELSNLISDARIYAGITQEELADLMGAQQSAVARAESGGHEVKLSFIERVAKAVGTELVLPRFAFMNVPKVQNISTNAYSNASFSILSPYHKIRNESTSNYINVPTNR